MARRNHNNYYNNRYGSKNVQTNEFGEISSNKHGVVTHSQSKQIEKLQGATGRKFAGDSYEEAKQFILENRVTASEYTAAPKAVACIRRDCEAVIKEGEQYYDTKLGKHCSEDCWLLTASEVADMELKTFRPKLNGAPEPQAPKHIKLPTVASSNLDVSVVLETDSPSVEVITTKAKSGAKGVYPNGDGIWRAMWYYKGEQFYVGLFTTVSEASIARDKFIANKKRKLEQQV